MQNPDNEQRLALVQVTEPGVDPLPGQKNGIGGTLLEQPVPTGLQRLKARLILDALDEAFDLNSVIHWFCHWGSVISLPRGHYRKWRHHSPSSRENCTSACSKARNTSRLRE